MITSRNASEILRRRYIGNDLARAAIVPKERHQAELAQMRRS
jgi:hypothetical protein